MTDLIGITNHAWQRGRSVVGRSSVGRRSVVGRSSVGRSDIGNLGNCLTIAKIANQCGLIGNLGYLFTIAKIAQKESRNKKNGCWRGVVASLIGAKVLAILAKLSAFLSRRRLTHITPPLFFKKTMTILPIAEKASSNQTLTSPADWQFSHFRLPSL